MGRKCAARECGNTGQKLFSLPCSNLQNKKDESLENNKIRCRRWLQNSGRSDLLNQDLNSLCRKFYLCASHFDDEQFNNYQRETLKKTVIPTIFSGPNKTQDSKEPIPDERKEREPTKKSEELPEKHVTFTDTNAQILDATLELTLRVLRVNPSSSGQMDKVIEVEETDTRKSPKKSNRSCKAKDCLSTEQRLFSLPKPSLGQRDKETMEDRIKRRKQWVINAGRCDVLEENLEKMQRKFILCSDHFTIDQFRNNRKQTFVPNAVPTIFHHTANALNDEHQTSGPGTSNSIETDASNRGECYQLDSNHPTRFGGNIRSAFDKCQLKFESAMSTLDWKKCNVCKEEFYTSPESKKKKTCPHSKNICPMYSESNNMDPGPVPIELQDLTYVEEQLMAKVHPLITVCKLKGHQFASKGNVINFPKNVKSFAKKLPHRISDLSSSIAIKTGNEVNHVDFYVRAAKVRTALEWLKEHNPFYFDIELSEENLQSLPQNGNVFGNIPKIVYADQDSQSPEKHNDSSKDDDSSEISQNDVDLCGEIEEESDVIYESCAPIMERPTEEEQINTALNWPDIEKQVIDEFNTVGYIAQAFPTLFPSGKADLRSSRETGLSPLKYFQHLMRYEDGRFSKHPRFRYFAFNSIMRWSALRNRGVFVKRAEGTAF